MRGTADAVGLEAERGHHFGLVQIASVKDPRCSLAAAGIEVGRYRTSLLFSTRNAPVTQPYRPQLHDFIAQRAGSSGPVSWGLEELRKLAQVLAQQRCQAADFVLLQRDKVFAALA